MNKIKILPTEEALKISAGEVVERPSNIVKEIIENSIDAQSTQISLYIEEAGKKLIRIVDNGCGMTLDDAKLCFTNHATSKISNLQDLLNINSFGFRGEALASISSVSKVCLITKTNNSELGVKIEYSENKLLSQMSINCPVGTDVQIHDLFYNIPVRKKFLKQDETEWNQILNIFNAFCLSNINIHFKLYKDEKLVLNAPATQNLKDRTTQLFGYNFGQNLINIIEKTGSPVAAGDDTPHKLSLTYAQLSSSTPIEDPVLTHACHPDITLDPSPLCHPEPAVAKTMADKLISVSNPNNNNLIKITGLISSHNFWQYGKHKIFIFVNNRYIKDIEITKALVKGYTGVLPPMRYPAAFIFITVSAHFVDINVHPKKEEVRFLKPNTVNNFLQNLVKESLDNNIKNLLGKAQTQYSSRQYRSVPDNSTQDNSEPDNSVPSNNFYANSANQEITQELTHNFNTHFMQLEETKIRPNILHPRELEYEQAQDTIYKIDSVETRTEFKIIGQYLRTYIITQSEDNLILIDQHAAHERIIYDELTQNFENKSGIRLMFPEIINLNDQDLENIKFALPFLANQGIEIESFGKNQIAIKSSPPKIQNQSLQELIFEILESIKEFSNLDEELFRKKLNDRIHAQISCKAAVKAGDSLSFEQMENIVKKLQDTTNPLLCPHGRPTTWILNKYLIEKNFKR